MINLGDVAAQAESKLAAEDFRRAVESRKQTLREYRARPFWQRILPFRISIERIKDV